VAVTRWSEFTGDMACLEETNETFAEVMARRRSEIRVDAEAAE